MDLLRVKQLPRQPIIIEEKLLDFTYISDCIGGIIKSIQRFDNVKGNAFDMASGKGTTLLELARIIQDKTGASGKVVTKPKRASGIVQFIADMSKAKELLNYEPEVSIDDGMEKTIQ